MLRKLTVDQINDWFTIGKAVSGVEFLGGEVRTAGFAHHLVESVEEPPPAANVTRVLQNDGEEYIKRYRQLEVKELEAEGGRCSSYKPGSPQHESTFMSYIPDGDYKYPDLPISRYKEEMLSLIENHSVVIVHGSTGSGKSTQLPQYVLDHCAQHSIYCNIAVTQPRRIGASSIARWISKQRSWPLGELVGYQVGLEKVATKNTKLIYMTTGVLLQKVVGAKSLLEFTHIFIDEIHERTEDMDLLLLVIRKLLRTNSRFVKVILMSATIDCQEFANYFALPVRNKLYPAYVFQVEGKPHVIDKYYLDDLKPVLSHIKIPLQIIEEPLIHPVMYKAAIALIQWFDELETKENGDRNLEFVSERGSVLVFLPGLAEITYLLELLTNMVHRRLQVYPLHSSVTLEEQNNVFLAPVPGYRKILLSTNIAQSSVTVPDVKYVIDFCLSKNLVCDEDTSYQSLRLCWASKNSCDQRKGRAGRVSKGYCYRLVYKDFWANCIPESTVPEMMRCPLETTVLKVKMLDMGEPRALLATALSPPVSSDIERTILHLKEVGALAINDHFEERNPYDGELTFLGKVLAQLPVNHHLGKLIVLGHVFGCLEETLIIAAALSLNSFFVIPFKQHLDGYSQNEVDWGRSNYIHIKRMREMAELYEDLKKRVGVFNMHVNTHSPIMDQEHAYKQRFILQVVIAGAFYPNYFTFVHHDKEVAVRELSGRDPKTTVMLKNIPHYGFLYYKQLQSLFRQCGQVKSIVYDGTKSLYVDCGSVMVFYVDYGNRSKVALDQLREIPGDLRELPFQALEFKVRRIRPSAWSLVCGEQWSYAANQRFASLVSGHVLTVKIFSIVHGILHVDVFQSSGIANMVNICTILIEEGYAEPADDSYESKLSLVQLSLTVFLMCEKEFLTCHEEGVDESRTRYTGVLCGLGWNQSLGSPVLQDHDMELAFDVQIDADDITQVTLLGPFNAYNLKFSSMTRISRFRTILVEKESVNSVVVVDAPENAFQQILVAASISVNATGSVMMLKETSLMPHIPGLPALLSMLFAPVIDLRVDESRTRYTGVLCGLGWNQSLGSPVLQDHDMELAFDVQIDADDITQLVFELLGYGSKEREVPITLAQGSPTPGVQTATSLQPVGNRGTEAVLICKSKPREAVPPTWYKKSYEWTQVRSSLIIDQSDQPAVSRKNSSLFQLHKLVLLNA
ncbi:PREDICTED: putative ATP-dependent RNA helicase TDRD9 [Thamnophis sirtalis]|uniref:ATP-dependent RNA helicase TDRD9 n=1 Tax=Thamnophis sirtalis TaxID=35019 RepID=A0A6I9XMD3_9SAUR|nr:PREDICTED: putative ATP-dependent RNA helicase TDRD9 [Thamnophis sirtalis]